MVSSPLAISLVPYADLVVTSVTSPTMVFGDPATAFIEWTVRNDGTGVGTTDRWTDRVILSVDEIAGNGDDRIVGEFVRDGVLALGQEYTRQETILLPVGLEDRFHVFVTTDAEGLVFENGSESNNTAESSVPMDVSPIRYSDLVVDSFVVPGNASSGQPLELSWTVTNNGIVTTDSSQWIEWVYLARDAAGTDLIRSPSGEFQWGVFEHNGALAVGQSYVRSAEVQLTPELSGDIYPILLVAPGTPYEFLYKDNNRVVSSAVNVTLSPTPDLSIESIAAPPEFNSGGKIDVTWTVRNIGSGDATTAWTDRVSIRKVGDPDAIPTTIGTFTYSLPILAGRSYVRSEQVKLPDNLQGVYELIVETNLGDELFENGAAANNRMSQSILLTLPARPDLQVETITVPASASAGGTAQVEFTIINQGTVPTSGRWQDRVYLSLDGVISSDDIIVAKVQNQTALGPGERYTTQVDSVTIPRRFRGDVFVLVQTDADNNIAEFPQEANNVTQQLLAIDPLPPSDLVISGVVAPTQVFDGAQIEVRYTVTNLGVGETDVDGWTDTVWLTTDKNRPNVCSGDFLIGRFQHDGSLEVGESYDQIVTVTVPEGGTPGQCRRDDPPITVPGDWYVTVWTDTYDVVTEDTFDININPDDPNELDNNNYKARGTSVLAAPPPDLVVTNVTAPASGTGGESLTVSWTVENQGSRSTKSDQWFDRVIVSTHPTLDAVGATTWDLGHVPRSGLLNVGSSYTAEATFQLSPEVSGQYVIVVADTLGDVWEGSYEDNNEASTGTQVDVRAPADLQVTSVVLPTTSDSGQTVDVTWTVQNFGADVWSGTQFWTDFLYISTSPQFDLNRATLLKEVIHDHAPILGAGQSYTMTEPINLPRGADGVYYVHVWTDPQPIPNPGLFEPTSPPQGLNDANRAFYVDKGSVYEGGKLGPNELNNTGSSSLTIHFTEPDLVVTNLILPTETPLSGQTATISWTVTNNGTAATYPSANDANQPESRWIDRVYLSKDPSLDSGDWFLGEAVRELGGPIGIGESYDLATEVEFPLGISGDFYVLVFVDSNITERALTPDRSELELERGIPVPGDIWAVRGNSIVSCAELFGQMARVQEFGDEANNLFVMPMTVGLADPPDLQVTSVVVPERANQGQFVNVTYTVANVGTGAIPPDQLNWDDLIYLSRDPFLDLNADRYIASRDASVSISAPGESYTVTQSIRLPKTLTGPYYVFVVTDPSRPDQSTPRGVVFEMDNERNNASTVSPPLIIETPPPTDLQVQSITIPSSGRSGDPVHVEWTVVNADPSVAAEGRWVDSAYLSDDAIWDIGDTLIGRVDIDQSTGLAPSGTYTATLDTTLPPAKPGDYRVIVRTDVLDDIFEAQNEANNRTASADTINLTVDSLQLGVELETTLSTGQSRLYKVDVGPGETLRVSIQSDTDEGANEIFLRRGDVPTGIRFDAAYEGQLGPNQSAVIGSTQPGEYYVLVRGHSEPENDTPVTILAELLPFQITDVIPDFGGDSRWVTTTILGSKIGATAVPKLVRPQFGEFEAVNYQVFNGTKIIATFDLRDAPHGLYDVKVVNPDGAEAILPYRYLIQRAVEPDVSVGMGGPRVLAPGDVGTYGVSVRNITNVDAPYVHFEFGVPELGPNEDVFGFQYVTFSSNVGGAPTSGDLDSVPWASLNSSVNASGLNLAPGYAFDLPTQRFAGMTFNAHTYPGLKELEERNFNALRDKIYKEYPDYVGYLDNGPEGLDDIFPGLFEIYQEEGSVLDPDMCDTIAFTFDITAAATALTRDEFIAQQTEHALRLRQAILQDSTASLPLRNLASDTNLWTTSYLAALEEAGILRAVDDVPPIREAPHVLSLMATLTSGILAGPAGEEIITGGGLVDFFAQVRAWYGHDADQMQAGDPERDDFDLGLSQPTHYESFNIYVPFATCRVDLPQSVDVPVPDTSRLLAGQGVNSPSVRVAGPFGSGAQQFVPTETNLPYTIEFQNPSSSEATTAQVRITTQLDSDLDPRSFRLGDIRVGDIDVHIPNGRSVFQGNFDFIETKGFILQVSAVVDTSNGIATWLMQAIDPNTGELVQDSSVGLLPPNNALGAGAGSVSYTVRSKSDATTGTKIATGARAVLNNLPPLDATSVTHTLDATAPTTSLTAKTLGVAGTDYLVSWGAVDDATGSGVKHVTVYVAEDGGDFKIWKQQTVEASGIYSGAAGHAYEFLALATDNAGNRETAPLGTSAPDDGSGTNLGDASGETTTSSEDLPPAPEPNPTPSTNPLFVSAGADIPSEGSASRPSEFASVLSPFYATSFATDFEESHADIGPMGIAVREDGSVYATGGPGRNQLFLFPPEGGVADAPIAELAHPLFDIELADDGTLWAATGGGPLLQIDPNNGVILGQFGDGITQSLAIDHASGRIYVSSGRGVELFDPATSKFTLFSKFRVGNLAIRPSGELWGVAWPQRDAVVRFTTRGKAEAMLDFDSPIDSIAFGVPGTQLAELLFVTHNRGEKLDGASELTMVDLVTLQRIAVANGGTRGDIIEATDDGRLLISQSTQIDVFSPTIAPQIAATSPPADGIVALPRRDILVTFDQPMYVGVSTDVDSVLNPSHYSLIDDGGDSIALESVQYDASTQTALLTFEAFTPDTYTFDISATIKGELGSLLAAPFSMQFLAISDFSDFVDIEFTNARSHRTDGTVSYDVTITNTSTNDLLLPLMLVLDPGNGFDGTPLEATRQTEQQIWLIDLSEALTDGVLKSGESTTTRTVTILNPDDQQVRVDHGVYTLPTNNLAPVFTSEPIVTATVDTLYTYQVIADDPDGSSVSYLLYDGPEGMTIDTQTGLVTWLPTGSNRADASVVIYAYDARGGFAFQPFTVELDGGNHGPEVRPLPEELLATEGELLEISIAVTDADRDNVAVWVENLPPGAVFDSRVNVLRWTPSFDAAGTYRDVRFIATDGHSTR